MKRTGPSSILDEFIELVQYALSRLGSVCATSDGVVPCATDVGGYVVIEDACPPRAHAREANRTKRRPEEFGSWRVRARADRELSSQREAGRARSRGREASLARRSCAQPSEFALVRRSGGGRGCATRRSCAGCSPRGGRCSCVADDRHHVTVGTLCVDAAVVVAHVHHHGCGREAASANGVEKRGDVMTPRRLHLPRER
jgi:hypothetical protein